MNLMKIATPLFIEKLGSSGAGLGNGAVTNALGGLLGDAGGNIDLASIILKLDGGGFASLAQSWLGDGANSGISAQQLMSLFGESQIGNFASSLDLDLVSATQGLAGMLPELIDGNSRGGRLFDLVGSGGSDKLNGT
jgi:uncharacterized protein YidB (DUF937 family)